MRELFHRIERGGEIVPSILLDELALRFPLISQMEETPQDPLWHAEGNVRVHAEMVVEEALKILGSSEGEDLSPGERLALVMGAALHDIGKVLTTREEIVDGSIRIVSPRHPERGRSYLAPRMPVLELEWDLCDRILSLVGYHHEPGKLVHRGKGRRGFTRLRRAVDFRLVYLLELADLRGRRLGGGDDDRDGFGMLELFRQAAESWDLWGAEREPYREWRELILDRIDDPRAAGYTFRKAIRDFEEGRIHTPEEAIARTWEWRDDHPEVTVMCGPSGTGKSSWIGANCPGVEVIALDALREEIAGRADDQGSNGRVLQAAKERLRQALREKRAVVWDATAIRRDNRSLVTGIAHDYHALSRIVAVACPPELAQSRNRGRERRVAGSVIDRQFERLQWPEVWEADEVEGGEF